MIVGNLSGLDQNPIHTVYVYNQLEVLGGKAHGVGSYGIPHVGSLSLMADREGNILRHPLRT